MISYCVDPKHVQPCCCEDRHSIREKMHPYDRGVLDALKIVEDHWSEPEGYDELITKISKLIDSPASELT